MDQELPEWLDSKFLETALQGEETVHVKVNEFFATLAVAAGENYLSRIYRVKVYYNAGDDEKYSSLIVKAPFVKGVITEMSSFYEKESNVYNHFLPKLNLLANCEFGPKSLNCSKHNALVLSDLKEQGYVMCDRYKQLDFPHCEQVIGTLSKFHAASIACKRKQPDLIDVVGKESLYVENDMLEAQKVWLEKTVKTVAELAEEIGLEKTMVSMLIKCAEEVGHSAYRLCKPRVNGLNVINHGDLWVNNILFKYSTSGAISDVKFIDFQISRYASPVLDLINFFWTSANEDVRQSRLPELSEIYRLALNSTLASLGCEERLTEAKLQEEFRDAIDWAVIVICGHLPFIVCETDNVFNLEECELDDFKDGHLGDNYLKMFRGKRYRALLPKIMEHFMNWANIFQ